MTERKWIIGALAVLGVTFLCLLPFDAGQLRMFPYPLLCDFRCFITSVISEGVSYSPSIIDARDACYPPIAYDLILRLFGCGRKVGCPMSAAEVGLVASLFVLQLSGLLCLAGLRGRFRLAAIAAVIVTPAFLCPLLRGNPIGWSFAFVCFFLKWFDSPRRGLRLFAACSLAVAAALKISPCLYGLMYVSYSRAEGLSVRWRYALTAAAVTLLLVFVPFFWHGGFETLGQWISNAADNARHYSCNDPIWGFVPLAGRFTVSAPPEGLVQSANLLTKASALFLALLTVVCRERYTKLLFLGSAMTFLTYHDYGALYLLPAFFAYLTAAPTPMEKRFRIIGLLTGIAWVVVLMPLQICNPCFGSLNEALQGEMQLLLLAFALTDLRLSVAGKCDIITPR